VAGRGAVRPLPHRTRGPLGRPHGQATGGPDARRHGPGTSPRRVDLRRGLLDRLVTRIYFGDEEAANATDPALAVVDPDRRHLLVAARSGPREYRLDIHLQGPDESVFFAI